MALQDNGRVPSKVLRTVRRSGFTEYADGDDEADDRMTPGLDDREAIRRVAGRDSAGLEWLYDRYATLVYSLALRIVRDASDAEDITQEVFAQVWTQAARFDASRGAVGAWLTVIARSRSLDRLRRRGAAPQPSGDVEALANIQYPPRA